MENKGVDFDAYGDGNDMYRDPLFNPIAQYEQACMYYKYLTAQIDYKIKCKEYDKLCKSDGRAERRVE